MVLSHPQMCRCDMVAATSHHVGDADQLKCCEQIEQLNARSTRDHVDKDSWLNGQYKRRRSNRLHHMSHSHHCDKSMSALEGSIICNRCALRNSAGNLAIECVQQFLWTPERNCRLSSTAINVFIVTRNLTCTSCTHVHPIWTRALVMELALWYFSTPASLDCVLLLLNSYARISNDERSRFRRRPRHAPHWLGRCVYKQVHLTRCMHVEV